MMKLNLRRRADVDFLVAELNRQQRGLERFTYIEASDRILVEPVPASRTPIRDKLSWAFWQSTGSLRLWLHK